MLFNLKILVLCINLKDILVLVELNKFVSNMF